MTTKRKIRLYGSIDGEDILLSTLLVCCAWGKVSWKYFVLLFVLTLFNDFCGVANWKRDDL